MAAVDPLVVEGLSLRFGAVEALRGVGFRVGQGEIFGIIGPNGAGKTSLLNVVSGTYRASAGRVHHFGVEGSRQPRHRLAGRGIARTFQNVALFGDLTVLENILVGRHQKMGAGLLSCGFAWPFVRAEARRHREAARAALAFLDLEGVADAHVEALPYGVKKKVELARAIAMEPKLLLLDEPLAGMNAAEKQDIAASIRRIRDRFGTTVVMIEHDIGLVVALSDRVMALDHGEKIAEGAPADVRRDPEVVRAYFGDGGDALDIAGHA
ncbi:amino acid/amide ABC transporter ATP-binding protein 1 (HAAT family) [Stella humosa]|uniref:Amino acid/amide ABC transporter ATP-binding protein 1 (HAAT family) n=1 Tax=Stella humosa TaxID=94 RepID=A0A3N1KSJ2_9PROT|nr:ABC transporter ATP-binding protein [Stella humosa]ROP81360.1 amino acid/amide ABC transporter ATP-binding protein 1 (HAAT family) [Stella humosa]BBK32710.1 ABC transporter ATP-binding protein [Stella humosa]